MWIALVLAIAVILVLAVNAQRQARRSRDLAAQQERLLVERRRELQETIDNMEAVHAASREILEHARRRRDAHSDRGRGPRRAAAPFSGQSIKTASEEEIARRVAPAWGAELEICFTGFTEKEKQNLSSIARSAGMTVRTTVTRHVVLICVGETPGEKKLEAAAEIGALVVSPDQVIAIARRRWDQINDAQDDIPF